MATGVLVARAAVCVVARAAFCVVARVALLAASRAAFWAVVLVGASCFRVRAPPLSSPE